MRTKTLIIATAAIALISAPAFAAKNGFTSTTTTTQGSSGHPANTKNSTSSQGDTTTTGPYGQVKQGKSANTTTSGPGNGK